MPVLSMTKETQMNADLFSSLRHCVTSSPFVEPQTNVDKFKVDPGYCYDVVSASIGG
jgi:hypothetical protein